MSRRDTIIIAVLINISLLVFLFMLAINTDEEDTPVGSPSETSQVVVEAVVPPSPENFTKETIAIATAANANAADEVDNFLKDLSSTQASSQPIEMDEEGYVELEKEPPVAVKPASSEEKEEARFVEVTVKRGDALEKIARNNGTTVEAIKKANNITSTKLSIGQVLRVPVGSKKNSTVASTAKPANAPAAKEKDKKGTEPQYYTLKSGDSPWKIAKQFQVNFEDLLKMNDISEEKARNLKVGDKIRVR